MSVSTLSNIAAKIRSSAVPVVHRETAGSAAINYGKLIDAVGDAQVVMIGEASHGTHDFYKQRAEISKILIEKKGFTFIAVEADWPDAYRVNRYVQNGKKADTTATEALGDFRRFPMWMWRNTVMEDFVKWLREHNDQRTDLKGKVAFYGMDLYSFFSSMDAVVEYLDQVSPEDAKIARTRYGNFERFQGEPQMYGYASGFGLSKSFENEVVSTVLDLHKKEEEYLMGAGGLIDGDELFYVKQNAEIVKNAENYYRKMYHADESTWNLRDKHMADCISNLFKFHKTKFPDRHEKVILWAHNSHLGDARATDKGKQRHEWNIGQLMRERFGLSNTFNIGFSTYTGSVTASKTWDKPGNCYRVRNGFYGSYEHTLHLATEGWEHQDFSVVFRSNNPNVEVSSELKEILQIPRYERYIGVIYRPDTERPSHYTVAVLPKEYDAVIFMDRTNALVPLDMHGTWERQHKEIKSLVDCDLTPEIEPVVPIPRELADWRLQNAKILNDIGVDYTRREHLAMAVMKFDKAVQYVEYDMRAHPESKSLRAKILLNRADANFQLKAWSAVVRDCEMVLELDPDNMHAHLLLGEAFQAKGLGAKAQKHIDIAASLAARSPKKARA